MTKYANRGFTVIGFPCAQFDNQQPEFTSQQILDGLKYVRPGGGFVANFPLMAKSDVNGASRSPGYAYLTGACPQPMPILEPSTAYISWAPIRPTDITWNFQKYLIHPDTGRPVSVYSPDTLPSDIAADIEALLK